MSGGDDMQAAHRIAECFPPITVPYLLVTNIPCYVDEWGKRWTDALWFKDISKHAVYLKRFTLAAPLRCMPPPEGSECLSNDHRLTNIGYVDLPASNSLASAILNWPATFMRLWRAAGEAGLVHAGVAGWPIPTGWAATIAAKARRRALLINVESAFWRAPTAASRAKRVQSFVWETINRWCVRQADLPLFTHQNYAAEMLKNPARGYVFQASWVDSHVILEQSVAEKSWALKESSQDISILYAGRLIPEKGVLDLLAGLEDITGPVHVDIIGTGDLAGVIQEAASSGLPVRLLPSIPYGNSFFKLVGRYHAVIVPNRSDEQPRIVYDAYSQAVPVLATDTPGNRACIIDGQTGYLATVEGPLAVRQLIEKALTNRASLREMGLRSLTQASSYTHEEMHRRRWRLLAHFFGKGVPSSDIALNLSAKFQSDDLPRE